MPFSLFKRFSYFFSLLVASGLTLGGYAQNFPVRITPTLAPPFTPFLTDLTAPGSEKLLVHITLSDPTVSDYHCKLRLTIEGVNITISSHPAFTPPPLILQGGVPEFLNGVDLAEYFKYQNLTFKGISQADLEKSGGKLPEGIYRFTFEVLDYNRGTLVSNAGISMAWMILNDPPIINMPVANSKITPFNPQNVIFQWTPRHSGSPNAAFSTEYAIKLVEIWPAGRNANDAFNTSQPILETVTENTQFVYDINETPLVIGREYALQIQARDAEGRDLFRNNGRSEVVKFTYGEACPMPTQLTADDINTAGARMRWQSNGRNTGYRLRYREKEEGAEWFEQETTLSYFNAKSMKTGATYEYEVCGVCDFYESEFSSTQNFTTLVASPSAFACGAPDIPRVPGVPAPAPALFLTDTIKAAGYRVLISHIEGMNGTFTGEGFAIVPWFNSAKVRVTFNAIRVNQNHELIAGAIQSVWNPNSPFLLDDPKKLNETGTSQLKVTAATFEADTLIALPGTIIIVETNTDGDIVVQTNNGAVTIQKEEGKTYAITDQTGNGYLVDKDGKVTKTTTEEASQAAERGERNYSNDPNKNLRFVAIENTTRYGLDEQRTGTIATNYQQTSNGKYVAWKALSSGEIDVVQAVTEGNVNKTKLKFKLEGMATQDLTASSDLQINLRGQTEETVEELLAYHSENDTAKNPLILAKLNLASYAPLQRNLVLIKVNDATSLDGEDVQRELNKIYSQAVVSWTVDVKELSISSVNTSDLDDGSSGMLSNYTADMRAIINTYFDGAQPTTDTYYIFLVRSAHDKLKLGFMPRKKQAGFVFTDAHATNTDHLINTIAHELGHGAFRLEHTFPEVAEGISDNLMDYGNGTRLNKYQWDYIHDPVPVIGLFEDDEEGASIAQFKDQLLDRLDEDAEASNCWIRSANRGWEVYQKFDYETGIYAGIVEFLLCGSENANCGSNGLTELGCGFSNGLLQELDWITLVESVQNFSIDEKAIIKCIYEKIPLGSHPDNPLVSDVIFECITGVKIGDLKEGIKEFIEENWDEPYYQGQATAFVLTLLSPLKGKVLTKLKELPRYASKISRLEIIATAKSSDELLDLTQAISRSSDELAAFWKSGWNQQKVLDILKGSRPDPSEYLKAEYISSHLAKFEQDGVASRIILKDVYSRYGIGKPDPGKTEFVSLKSDIDKLLTESNGNAEILSKALGVPKEQLAGGLVRVDFKVTSRYKAEMPSGNEFGTNPQWLPGGKLPTGQPEAVMKTEGMVKDIDYIVVELN